MDFEGIARRAEEAFNNRGNWDSEWQATAERVLPQMADFNVLRADGERRTEKMFDSTAARAATKAVAVIAAYVYPGTQQYQEITSNNTELNKVHGVKEFWQTMTERVMQARYSPRANFESQMGEVGLQHMVFGTGLMFVDDNVRNRALRYKSLALSQTYLLENADGVVDTVMRKWQMTLRQIEQKWPGKLPPKLQQRLEKSPDEKVDVAHAVCPREEYDATRLGYPGMPWASVYWLRGEKVKLSEGGFRAWPFPSVRGMTSVGEVYGRSPASMALSNIKVLNAQKRSVLQAAQKVVDPPLLASDDGLLSVFDQTPGAVNFGALDGQGNQLVKPLITNADVRIGMDMMQAEKDAIADWFMQDLMRVFIENPQLTATQALQIVQERGILMAPIVGRFESGFFGPLMEREIQLMDEAGQFDDLEMPGELMEAAGEYKIEYTSPARKMMRASESIAITRTIEQLSPWAQIDPSVLDIFDPEQAPREMADINGVPAKALRSPEDVKALRESRTTQQEAAQLLEAAPVASEVAKNLTAMQASAGRPQI